MICLIVFFVEYSPEELTDLLVDHVTLKAYKCSFHLCRKTFDSVSELYAHE